MRLRHIPCRNNTPCAAAENPTISCSVTADLSEDDGAGKRYFMLWMNATRFFHHDMVLHMATVP
jgi:hypothetical protein